ncbi:MAG: TetR/AcrR family transcriptional regulator [Flavobacteriales bacterium]|nr:TetR/AcrR family transcriptional regulator [Flavobacteriales bacterium]
MDIKPRQLEIIEAAGQLVTEDGFAALTTKRLAERMHFTEAALYRHFASKEEILVTMLHHLAANIDERLAAVAETHPEPVERVRAMFDSQFTYFQKTPNTSWPFSPRGCWRPRTASMPVLNASWW